MTRAILVDDMWKRYQVGRTTKTASEIINDRIGAALRLKKAAARKDPREEQEHERQRQILGGRQYDDIDPGHFWALRNVGFEIAAGERVGIIGPNGCGKSTLLKILSRITPPTRGRFVFEGSVISLLEVGTGFSGDLTGRDNVFLNGTIMGMPPREIEARFDSIVEFSELGDMIDTPVKRYSSGMYVRLAFSVAAHLISDILIVDEVLAVGDAAFQRKCLDKMLEISGRGRTLLFVSHDMEAVNRLCNRVIELEHGEIKLQSAIEPGRDMLTVLGITQDYLRTGTRFVGERCWPADAPLRHASGVALHRVTLRLSDGSISHRVPLREPFRIEVEYSIEADKAAINVHAALKTLNNLAVLVSMNNHDVPTGAPLERGRYVATLEVTAPLLNAGDFRLDLDFWVTPYSEERLKVASALVFSVVEDNAPVGVRGDWPNEWPHSMIRPGLRWISRHVAP